MHNQKQSDLHGRPILPAGLVRRWSYAFSRLFRLVLFDSGRQVHLLPKASRPMPLLPRPTHERRRAGIRKLRHRPGARPAVDFGMRLVLSHHGVRRQRSHGSDGFLSGIFGQLDRVVVRNHA